MLKKQTGIVNYKHYTLKIRLHIKKKIIILKPESGTLNTAEINIIIHKPESATFNTKNQLGAPLQT